MLITEGFFLCLIVSDGVKERKMWSSAKAETPAGAGATKNLGMTAPISQAGPEPRDLELTADLQQSLIPHGCFESEGELNHRMNVLR